MRFEADIDGPDFAGGHGFVQRAGVEITVAHTAGRKRQLLERSVDQACNQGGTSRDSAAAVINQIIQVRPAVRLKRERSISIQ